MENLDRNSIVSLVRAESHQHQHQSWLAHTNNGERKLYGFYNIHYYQFSTKGGGVVMKYQIKIII